MLTKAPKGTKDILPSEVYKWQYVEQAFAEICRRHGFGEIRTPDFEHTELFKRGVGGTTDIVQKEMYTWEQAKRSLTLRPEGTSPVVRAMVEHKLYAEPQPLKFYYDIPCSRYEKPQAGRLRAFHQCGVEVFGTDSMMADAEVIALAQEFLAAMGIENIELRINSIGCPACREDYKKALREFLAPKYDQLCDTCKSRYETNPMRILDCKSPEDQALVKGAPRMLDYLCDDCRAAFEELKADLDAMHIAYTVDAGIVRGLDYYTKTAFEFVTDTIGAQGTVCGGGRYDHLAEEIGGPAIPGVGFGLGIERLLITMEAAGVEIPHRKGADASLVYMGDAARRECLSLLRSLHAEGLHAEMDMMARNVKNQFKYADRIGARYAVVIGDNEIEKKEVSVKDMQTGKQETVPFNRVVSYLKEKN